MFTKTTLPTTLFLLLSILFFLSGCAKQTTVILLPETDGKVGHVTVSTDISTVNLQQSGEKTVIQGRQSSPTSPKIISEGEIKADFGQVLDMMPEQPVHFLLYFKQDSIKLTTESEAKFPDILQTIKSRNSHDVIVIGHTDTAGNKEYNFRLSTKRARAIALILEQKGIDSASIKSTSHGEENPFIKTADNVHEPRNRRVEVVIR